MTGKDPGARTGRFVANLLILGGVLFAAIVGSLLLVLGQFGTEYAPESETYSDSYDGGSAKPERRRVERRVRGAEREWPAAPQDPAEVAPGTPPAPPRVRGRVEGPGGAPLGGVALRVGGAWVRTAEDGSFTAEVSAVAEPPRVHVLAPGYRLEAPIALDDPSEPLTIRLVADRMVTVRGFVSAGEGKPLAGADVRIHVYRTKGATDAFADDFDTERLHEAVDSVRDAFQPETTTAADGSYELRVPAVTRHFLVIAWADGHRSESSEPVHVTGEKDAYDVSVQLPAHTTLRGRVVDAETGTPIEGATVTTWISQSGEPGEDAVITDVSGAYVIEGAPRTTVYVLKDGHLRGELSHPYAGDDPVVHLVPARAIAGRVQYPDGTPVHGAYVSLASPSRRPRGVNAPRPSVTTDEDGAFRFESAWDADWTIAAVLTHYAKTNFLSAKVAGVRGGAEDVVVVVQRARAIAGRVLGPSGSLLAGVYVSCERGRGGNAGSQGSGAGVYSDREGRFELRGLVDGVFTVRATVTPQGMPSYLPAEVVRVASGAGDVELRMALGLSLRGRVLDDEGAPVAARLVLAIDPDQVGLAYHSPRGGTTDAEGRFEISGLEDRAYRLQLKPVAPEWARCYLEGADSLRPSGGELALRLSTGGAITGIVVDEAGAPLPDAEVQAAPMEHASRIESRTRTDPKGRFVLRGLIRSRRYKLYGGGATVEDLAPGTRDVRLE